MDTHERVEDVVTSPPVYRFQSGIVEQTYAVWNGHTKRPATFGRWAVLRFCPFVSFVKCFRDFIEYPREQAFAELISPGMRDRRNESKENR